MSFSYSMLTLASRSKMFKVALKHCRLLWDVFYFELTLVVPLRKCWHEQSDLKSQWSNSNKQLLCFHCVFLHVFLFSFVGCRLFHINHDTKSNIDIHTYIHTYSTFIISHRHAILITCYWGIVRKFQHHIECPSTITDYRSCLHVHGAEWEERCCCKTLVCPSPVSMYVSSSAIRSFLTVW